MPMGVAVNKLNRLNDEHKMLIQLYEVKLFCNTARFNGV